MSLSQKLQTWIQNGVRQIGELVIQSNESNDCFILSHEQDAHKAMEQGYGGLEVHDGPEDARDLSTHADDGSYRFVKAQTNLRRGWVMILRSAEDLRMALDHYYPASVGLHAAAQEGWLEIEALRDERNRQTGLYRFA